MLNAEDKGYKKELLKAANNYIIPFVIRWLENNEVITSNGTAFFLDTGSKKLLVTAAHVFKKYKETKKKYITVCQLGNIKFDPINKLLDCNEDLDIVTFDVSEHENTIYRLNKNFFINTISSWPPSPPEVGKNVFFAGFPGIERIHNQNRISFGSYNMLEIVKRVDERKISITYSYKEMTDEFGNGLPLEGYKSGGISGAPLIAIVDNKSGLQTWRLAGIIYEASTEWGIIFATRADFILADGNIKPLN